MNKRILVASMLMSVFVLQLLIVTVQAEITIDTPTSGQYVNVGDELWVNGSGASPGFQVIVYWDIMTMENVLSWAYAKGDGTFSTMATIPEDVAGDHWIIVDGASARVVITPKITLTPDTGLAGDTVSVKGTGFGDTTEVTLKLMNDTSPSGLWDMTLSTSPSTVETNSSGTFRCTFDIPSNATDYGTYTVNGTDAYGNSDEAVLTVGPTITLDTYEGPSGTVVAVDGEGFTEMVGLDVTITVGWTTAAEVADIETLSDGTFSGQFIVPTLSVGTHPVLATDSQITSGPVDFEVTGTTSIMLMPLSGNPGEDISIEGVNFTAIAGTEVTIAFVDRLSIPWKKVTVPQTFTANSTGGLKGTFTVPDHPDLPIRIEPYTLNATDENDLYAEGEFRIVRTRAFLDPEAGPSGGAVDVWVEGLTPIADYNITMNGELMIGPWAEGTLDANGQFPTPDSWVTVWVPTLSMGTHTITVMDSEGIAATASFDVTATTELVLTPSTAFVNDNVTIEANCFTAQARQDITIIIYNDTWSDNLISLAPAKGADPGHTLIGNYPQTNDTGSFAGWFLVPDLALGDYRINATDENGLGVWELDFRIGAPVVKHLLIVSSEHGSPIPSVGEHWYDDGAEVTASVTSPADEVDGTRYRCTGWMGTGSAPGSGTETTVTFTIAEPSNITWNWIAQYYLTVATDPTGLTPPPVVDPPDLWYDEGTDVDCTAQDVDGYTFTHWTVDDVSQGTDVNPITVTMNAPYIATAHHYKVERLSVKLAGEFDYLWREAVRIRLAALVMDANTLEPVSGADVTAQIYDIEGNNVSLVMLESIPGSGIYEWNSSRTIRELKAKKGVYLVRAQAFYEGAKGYAILLYHIDPPEEGSHQALLQVMIAATASAAATAVILKRREIIQRIRADATDLSNRHQAGLDLEAQN